MHLTDALVFLFVRAGRMMTRWWRVRFSSSSSIVLLHKAADASCLFLLPLLHIKAATDCLCWITDRSVLTTYLFVQSITNAAGGRKCQRAHHIISHAEGETWEDEPRSQDGKEKVIFRLRLQVQRSPAVANEIKSCLFLPKLIQTINRQRLIPCIAKRSSSKVHRRALEDEAARKVPRRLHLECFPASYLSSR